MIDPEPLVSVLMTSYNRDQYIGEAIESVLKSTCKNFELIIVDDCSMDKTVSIAKSFACRDKRIKVFINDKNLGDYANRNKAASYASGKYVKYLDSDDAIYNWGLEYCVESMKKYPEAGMGIFKASNNVEEEYIRPVEAVNKHFFTNSFLNIGPSGTILKRELFEHIGFFKPDYGAASDLYFNIRIASFFPVVILEKEFFFYRKHEAQEINNRYSYLLYNYPYIRDILKLPELPVSDENKLSLLTNAKRSFLKECFKTIVKTGKIKPAYLAFRHSQMNFKDVVSGILNKPL